MVRCAWVAAALLAGCTNPDPMQHQAKYKPYAESGFFEDGRAMRTPLDGIVPQERGMPSEAVETGRDGHGYVERIPLTLTRAELERGQQAFETTCAACHGLLGDGSSMVARKMALRPPPSLLDLPPHPPGYFFTVVTEGFGLMPGYAAEIPVTGRWALVGYLLALRRSQRLPFDEAPADIRAQLSAGGTP